MDCTSAPATASLGIAYDSVQNLAVDKNLS
jgi:hypothetical protein